MEEIRIDKEFATARECNEWEDKYLKGLVPVGKVMIMATHSSILGKEGVILESIFVC